MVFHYCSKGVKQYKRIEFIEWIKNSMSEYTYSIAISAIINNKRTIEKIRLVLFKKKQYGLLWFCFKR